jgi:hypothetical protein
VILFKLMTDQLPYAVEGMSLPEAWYHIEQQTARRPSQIDPTLRGDLETIILNAIADNPRHRYQTVQELSEDVHRYLSDRRPLRRPPSMLRELGRFAKRNRGVAASLGGIMLGLLAITGGTVYGLLNARQIIEEAQVLTDARRDVMIFISTEADEIRRATIEGRAREMPEYYRPNVDALAYHARRVRALGEPEDTTRILTELVQISEASLPEGHWYTAVLQSELAAAYMQLQQYVQAERYLLDAYASLREHVGPEHQQTLRAAQRIEQLYTESNQLDRLAEWRAEQQPDATP